ncbi:hypothetical protein GCM10010269_72500 [Streptomyces humidus]|uniref:Uncharacterized protein n=1 Tax=Streptomyces humidus TaxID=52259 RepID=A0A918G7T3_9ACTN|nr:hypothetical protein GCM10010269_72500 [Streptomyces humidus]
MRFRFSRLAHAEWQKARARLATESATLDWVFGPGTVHPETMEELYDEYGYLLRFRFETHGAVRRIRLRAEDPRRSTDWVPLDACAMTPEGLRLPGVRPRRRAGTGPAAETGARPSGAPVRRPREEQVLALKEALLSAARFRTRPTWEALARTAGSDLLGLPAPDRGVADPPRTIGAAGGSPRRPPGGTDAIRASRGPRRVRHRRECPSATRWPTVWRRTRSSAPPSRPHRLPAPHPGGGPRTDGVRPAQRRTLRQVTRAARGALTPAARSRRASDLAGGRPTLRPVATIWEKHDKQVHRVDR